VKPNKPGLYIMNGQPCLVAMVKGTLLAAWISKDGELQRARVWSAELKNATWSEKQDTK